MTKILKSLPTDDRRLAAEAFIDHHIMLTIGIDTGVIVGKVLTVARLTNGYRTDAFVLRTEYAGDLAVPLSIVRNILDLEGESG
jgi:hypothetical protein